MHELRPLLEGLSLRDVQPLPPRDLLFVFETLPAGDEGEARPAVLRLRISADPDYSRLHLQRGREQRAKGPPGPFFRRIAEELAGARLRSLTQVRGDRIVCLEFQGAPGGERRALFAELCGRHANLALTGPGERVLAVLVPAPEARLQQGTARLAPGAEWSPPPGRPPAAATLPSVIEEHPEPEGAPPGPWPHAPLSWRVERALAPSARERDREREEHRLARRIERKLARARGLLTGLEKKLAACADAERARLDGELLVAHLHALKRGMREVLVEDWYAEGSPQRRIELDPRRGPMENAERYFERYRKLERSREGVPAEIARTRARIAELEELARAAADPERDLAQIEDEAVRAGLLDPPQEGDPRKRSPPPPRLPYRSFAGSRGSEIRVGRTARDNDQLTFRHARGNDLWLHTADVPGSHVVLRLEGRGEPDPEELLDAAHLAVHFSPLRGAGRAAVHVARRKEVHKPRGAKPGLVTLSGGRKIELRTQPERLERLLRRDRPGDPAPD